jgi:hypothetical protein
VIRWEVSLRGDSEDLSRPASKFNDPELTITKVSNDRYVLTSSDLNSETDAERVREVVAKRLLPFALYEYAQDFPELPIWDVQIGNSVTHSSA